MADRTRANRLFARLTWGAGQALAGALRHNGVLEVLDVRGNALGAVGIGMLDKARDASAATVANRQILLPVSSR